MAVVTMTTTATTTATATATTSKQGCSKIVSILLFCVMLLVTNIMKQYPQIIMATFDQIQKEEELSLQSLFHHTNSYSNSNRRVDNHKPITTIIAPATTTTSASTTTTTTTIIAESSSDTNNKVNNNFERKKKKEEEDDNTIKTTKSAAAKAEAEEQDDDRDVVDDEEDTTDAVIPINNATTTTKQINSLINTMNNTATSSSNTSSSATAIIAYEILNDLIDYTKPAICGFKKCFYRHKYNTSIGYLVSQSSSIPGSKEAEPEPNHVIYKNMKRAYKLALKLEDEFPQIQHYYKLGKPIKFDLNNDMISTVEPPSPIDYIKLLNSNLNALKQYDHEKPSDQRFYFRYNQILYIQATLVAPTPHVMLACESDRKTTTINNIHDFIKNHVTQLDSFNQTLHYDLAIIRNMTSTQPYMKRYKCLIFDFQFILDKSGHLSHIDIDRCYNLKKSLPRIPSLNSINQCFHNVKSILKQASLL